MELLRQRGGHVYVAEAPIWDRTKPTLIRNDHLVLGITKEALTTIASRGLSTAIGQLYGVIAPGLIHAQHLFRGLKRPMMIGNNCGAAASRLIASWAQPRDARLVGTGQDPKLEYLDAPPNKVFVVTISMNEMLESFPQIYGWMDHWTWIAEDPDKIGAPIEWSKRYDKCLWTASPP